MERGTPFALAHTFRQTGPFRPRNVDRRVPGLVFVGSSTVPGVGVPMVLVSGKLAAARVAARWSTGPMTRDASRSRQSYAECQRLNKRYGTTYYWSTMVLPTRQAPPRPRPVRVLPLRRRHRRRPRPGAGRASGPPRCADFGDRFFADLDRGPVRRPRAEGRRAHRAGVRHRPRGVPALPAVDDDGPHGRALRDLRRPARLHGRLGGRDRRDDAADPRAARPGRRRGAGAGARRGVPADELPARHRRGPRPRPPVRAPGGPRAGSASTSPSGAARRRSSS